MNASRSMGEEWPGGIDISPPAPQPACVRHFASDLHGSNKGRHSGSDPLGASITLALPHLHSLDSSSYPRHCDVFLNSTPTLERRRWRDFVARGGLLVWSGLLWWNLATMVALAQQDSLPQDEAANATTPAQATSEAATMEARSQSPDDGRAGEATRIYRKWGGKIERVGPDTYILLDEQGNPQPVLNMRYEEFRALWEKQQALSDNARGASRPYTLDELQVSGTLETNHAALEATISITLHTREVVEVPLWFGASHLRRGAEGPRQEDGRLLSFDPAKGGFVATLQGEPGERIEMVLELITPLQRDGDRSSLRLLAPRANLSRLVLHSKQVIEELVASEGTVVEARGEGSGGTQIEAHGLGGEFRVSWEERREATTEIATVLSSSGNVVYEIDGSSIRTRCRLTVSTLGGAFDSFRVRLPAGVEYRSYNEPGGTKLVNSVSPDPVEEEEGSARGGKVYHVKLTEATKSPVVVELLADQQLERDGEDLRVTLGGFEVLGGVRQDGDIGLFVDDQWQVRWNSTENLQQIDPSELIDRVDPNLPRDELIVAMRYFSQPWKLDLQVSKRQRQVVAKPSYRLTLDREEATLDMTVNYEVSGVRSYPTSLPLNFALKGWTLVEEPVTSGLINADDTAPVHDRRDAVPGAGQQAPDNYLRFPTSSASDRQPRVVLRLRHRLPLQGESFELPMPYVDDDFRITTSDVTVDVVPSQLLTPDLRAMRGVAPKAIDDSMASSNEGAAGQRFYYRAFEPSGFVFAGSMKDRPQRIATNIASAVTVTDNRAEVVQVIDYQVRYQPLEELKLLVPSDLVRPSDLTLTWSRGLDQPPSATSSAALERYDALPLDLPPREEGVSATEPELRVALPHPQLGRMRVHARFSIPAPNLASEGTWIVPLLTPLDTELGRHQVTLDTPGDHRYAPVSGSQWKRSDTTADESGGVQFESRDTINYLPLVRQRATRRDGVTDIDRMWVQTWLTPRRLQQRVVLGIVSSESSITIELPEGVNGDELEVLVDGQGVIDTTTQDARLDIPLPMATLATPRTIELRYRQDASLGWIESLKVPLPRVAGKEALAKMYWQVITPTPLLAMGDSRSMTAAFDWQWQDGDWRSVPSMNTEELELWVRGVRRDTPTRGEHAYLWRCDPSVATLEVKLVRRELVVLGVSALVLGMGLALLYVPLLRRLPVLLVVVVAVAAVGLMYPTLARLVAQAGLLGGVALVVGVVLHLLLRRSQPEPQPASSSAGSSILAPLSRGSSMGTFERESFSTNAATVSVEMSDSARD